MSLPPASLSSQVGQWVAVNGAAAFSEFVTARSSLVMPLPDGVSAAAGTALVLSGVTAAVALEVRRGSPSRWGGRSADEAAGGCSITAPSSKREVRGIDAGKKSSCGARAVIGIWGS